MSERTPARRRRPVFSLLGGIAVSQVGNMALGLAIPWFVLETTGSAARTGIASAAMALGAVVTPALGGPLVDRIGFKTTSVTSDLIASAAIISIPLLHLAGLLEFWHIVVLIFLQSSFNSQGDAGRYALMPALADLARMPIERANAAERSVVRFAQFAGPVLGGFLIALLGAPSVMFLDSATFMASALLIAILVSAPTRPVVDSAANSTGYLTDLRAGFRFVRRNRLILSMLLIVAWGNFLTMPLVLVVLPVYAQTFWDSAATLGAGIGTYGAGAFAGTLLFGAVGRTWPKRATFLFGFIAAPLIGYGALAATPPEAIVFVAAALAGFLAGPINPILLTVIQQHTPAHVLGRTFAVVRAVSSAGIPIGAVLAGLAVETFDVVTTVATMGLAYVLVAVSMTFNTALKHMDAVPTHQVPVPPPPTTPGSPT